MDIIKFQNITKEYNSIPVVDNLSFEVKKGEIFGFLGPNGAGKSTSIKMMVGLLKPTEGNILINDTEISKSMELIGICPQDIVLWDYLTCRENLTLIGKMYNLPQTVLKKRTEEILDLLQLTDKKDTLISKLSGGMKRRMNIAMATIHNPELIVLDEPSEGLDPQSRRVLWDYILFLKNEGKTVILTTHLMDEADALSDRIAIIDNGKLLKLDTPENLKKSIGEGDTIEIELTNKELNQKVLDSITFTASKFLSEDKIILVTLNAANRLPEIVQTVENSNTKIKNVAIRQNTLEDVFIELTGRQLRD